MKYMYVPNSHSNVPCPNEAAWAGTYREEATGEGGNFKHGKSFKQNPISFEFYSASSKEYGWVDISRLKK